MAFFSYASPSLMAPPHALTPRSSRSALGLAALLGGGALFYYQAEAAARRRVERRVKGGYGVDVGRAGGGV